MSEKRKLDQLAAGGANPGANAANTTVVSAAGQQPGAVTQAKQGQPHTEEAQRRAEMRKALAAEVNNSRDRGVGMNPDQGQAPPSVTAGKVETGAEVPPDDGKAGAGDGTPTPGASASPLPAVNHDQSGSPGHRAKAYRERATRSHARAERYEAWTNEYVKGVRRRRSQSRKYRQKSFESEMLADGAEINGSISEEHRELGYTVSKLSEFLLEAGRLKINFDTLIVILRGLLTEKLRALGYTLPKMGEFMLEAASLEVEFDTLMAALRGLKASKG